MNISAIKFNYQNYTKSPAFKNSAKNEAVSTNAPADASSIGPLGTPVNFVNAMPCISFAGGLYSYNEPAIKTIEKIKAKGDTVPERVEKLAAEYAKNEETRNIRLVDVHKEAYKGLMSCKTLEEAKEMYPEFKDVKDANEVHGSSGSALEYLKSGYIEYFDEGDDVSLNILKYYWYNLESLEGFHWFATHKNTGRRFNFQATFSKLNIPKLSNQYSIAMRAQK